MKTMITAMCIGLFSCAALTVSAQQTEVLVAPPYSVAYTADEVTITSDGDIDMEGDITSRPLTTEEEIEFGIFGCNPKKWVCGDVSAIVTNGGIVTVYCVASNHKCAKLQTPSN